jgi:RNA processing factor Prp31
MYLITKWFGTFLCDKKGIKNKILFPKNEKEIAKRLQKINNKEILNSEKKLVKNVKVKVNEKRLEKIGEYVPKDEFFKNMLIESEDFNYSQNLLHKASILVTKSDVEKKLESEDLQVIQMVNALDDLIQTSNLLSERLDCWSAVPTPEKKVQPVKNTFSTVNTEINALEKQIESDMKEIAPNTYKIVGSLIGARLISYAGGLEKLAFMPASTIQVLGAEKALFRFKKEGGRPPKHGVIFQHQSINRANRKNRGKISRVIAANISIAARADAFTKRDIAKNLKENMNKRIKEIKNL